MKLTLDQSAFVPIQITLETKLEAELLKKALNDAFNSQLAIRRHFSSLENDFASELLHRLEQISKVTL